jgi:hypothetical protein
VAGSAAPPPPVVRSIARDRLEVGFGGDVLREEGGGAVLGGEGGVAVPCLEEARPPEIRALDPPGSAATVDPHKPPPPVRAAPLAALLGLRPALVTEPRVARAGPAARRREREKGAPASS